MIMNFLYSINLMPKAEEGKPNSNKIVNVVGDSIPAVLDKVNAAYPGADIRAVNKTQQIDIP